MHLSTTYVLTACGGLSKDTQFRLEGICDSYWLVSVNNILVGGINSVILYNIILSIIFFNISNRKTNKSSLLVGFAALPVDHMALPVGPVALPVGFAALPVGCAALPVDHVALAVGFAALPGGPVALPVGLLSLPVVSKSK